MAEQRAAPRLWTRAEGGQRRDHGHARRGRGMEEARSRSRMEAVGRFSQPYFRAGVCGKGSYHRGGAASRSVESHTQPASSNGMARVLESRVAKSPSSYLIPSLGSWSREVWVRVRTVWRVPITITPYMMMPGDEKVVADRLYAVLVEAAADRSAQTSAGRNRVCQRPMECPCRVHSRQRRSRNSSGANGYSRLSGRIEASS